MEEELLSRLDLLVSKVAEISPKVWAIYVKQQYIEAISILVSFLLVLFTSIFLWRFFNRNKWYEEYEGKGIGAFVVTVLLILTLIFLFICSILDAVPQLINPEYYTIKELVNFTK